MVKNLTSVFLVALLIFHPLSGLLADISTITVSMPDVSGEADWKILLAQLGVESGKTMTPDAYNLLLKKLVALPQMGLKIRASSPQSISLADWIRILKGLGIQPKPDMNEHDWALILEKANIDVSKGVSPSLAPPRTVSAKLSERPAPAIIPPVSVSPIIPQIVISTAPARVLASTTAVAVSQISTSTLHGVQVSSSPTPVMLIPVTMYSYPNASPGRVDISTEPTSVIASTPAVVISQITTSTLPGAQVRSSPIVAMPTPGMPYSYPNVSPGRVESSESSASPAAAAEPKTIAKRINLELKGMDIVEVLKLIARQGNLNLIIDSTVRGNVTLYLKDVDLWQAMRMALESADLAYAYDGNVVRVMSAGDYEKLYGTRFDNKTTLETLSLKYVKASAVAKYLDSIKSHIGKILEYDLSNALILSDTPEFLVKMKQIAESLDQPLKTMIFVVNYAKVEDLLAKLTPMVTKDIGDIQMDKRTNHLVITDYPDRLQPMAQLIQLFDEPQRAVLLEAKIVNVTLSNEYQFGVNWGYVFSQLGHYGIPGGVTGNFTLFPITSPGTPAGGVGTTGPGASGPIGVTASLGTLSNNNYTAMVQALQTVGKTELIASPRISVVNNETANILVGTKEAYVTTTVTVPGVGPQTTAEQINFVDVGVNLHVTPIIGADGYINLKIKPEVSDVDHTVTTAEGNSIPIVRTSQAETTVLVKDGETMLLAGLIQNQVSKTDSGVPLLSRIPLLGFLFRSSDHSVSKTELAVFLTPHIQAVSAQ